MVLVGFAEHAAVDAAVGRADEWARECMVLRSEIESLELELASRPGVKEHRALVRQVHELQADLSEERRSKREPLRQAGSSGRPVSIEASVRAGRQVGR